jgi:hypothetical protein
VPDALAFPQTHVARLIEIHLDRSVERAARGWAAAACFAFRKIKAGRLGIQTSEFRAAHRAIKFVAILVEISGVDLQG